MSQIQPSAIGYICTTYRYCKSNNHPRRLYTIRIRDTVLSRWLGSGRDPFTILSLMLLIIQPQRWSIYHLDRMENTNRPSETPIDNPYPVLGFPVVSPAGTCHIPGMGYSPLS